MTPKRITLYIINTTTGKSISTKILNDNNTKQRINKIKARYNKQPNIIFKQSS